jgi:soluble cytochrome b562
MEPEKKELSDDEKEYQAEFDSLAEGKEPAAPPEKKEEAPKAEAKEPAKPEPAPEPTPKPAEGGEPEGEPAKKPEPKPDETPADKGIAKALRDTKAWATKLAQENAELKKLVESKGKDAKDDSDVKKAQTAVGDTRKILNDKLNKIYEDYPELKEGLDPIVSLVDSLSGKMDNFQKATEEEKKRSELRTHFETNVEPEVLKVHPDFGNIKISDDYFTWAEKQSPALQFAAMNSLDPRDLIYAVTEYKKFKGSDEAAKQRDAEEKKKKDIQENLSSIRGGGSNTQKGGKPTKLSEVDKNDYDTAWNVLASQKK